MDDGFEARLAKAQRLEVVESKSTIESELKLFLHKKIVGPKLLELTKTLMAIEPTSVNNERVFSLANLILSCIRMRLGPEKFNNIVFINKNLE